MKKRGSPKVPLSRRFGDMLDGMISVFSPQRAMKRQMIRAQSEVLATAFRGAERGRLRGGWVPGAGSADRDLLPELPILRERSRDMVRNDPHAGGIVKTFESNVVGIGIRPQSAIDHEALDITEDQAEVYKKKMEKVWEKASRYLDASETQHIYEMQRLALAQMIINGEVFFLRVNRVTNESPYRLRFQAIEADRVKTPWGMSVGENELDVREGVEIGVYGEPKAYYVRETHPGDMALLGSRQSQKFRRIPRLNSMGMPNIIHLFKKDRPGQTRGMPWFAPVLNYFVDKADYMEAELVAARIAACYVMVIQQQQAYDAAVEAAGGQADASGNREEELEPGAIMRLNPGETINSFTPTRPSAPFAPFVEAILRAISSQLNLSYEVVAKDFSKTNYSSARAALLEARRFFRQLQHDLNWHFNQPVYEVLMEEAWLSGELDMPDFLERIDEWCRVDWKSPGWEWVDPLREVKAYREALESGITTQKDISADRGQDWKEQMKQQALEKAMRKKLGLGESAQKKAQKPAESEDEDDGKDQDSDEDKQDPDQRVDAVTAALLAEAT